MKSPGSIFVTQSVRRHILSVLLACGLVNFAFLAHAESIRIVALGASNTNGKGVSQAWPAVLETMLRAKGYEVTVAVNAINGDTSAGILSRVDSAVTPGTRVAIFDVGAANDRKRGTSRDVTEANAAQIASRIRALGARPIRISYQGLPKQGDGEHLTEAAHASVAASLVPKVIAAIGRRK